MPPRDGRLVPPTPCCVRLRSKTMFCRSDERPGLLHASDSVTYWCQLTNEDTGPDAKVTSHALCQPGRTCFTRDES